jgi:hypothetical protein
MVRHDIIEINGKRFVTVSALSQMLRLHKRTVQTLGDGANDAAGPSWQFDDIRPRRHYPMARRAQIQEISIKESPPVMRRAKQRGNHCV